MKKSLFIIFQLITIQNVFSQCEELKDMVVGTVHNLPSLFNSYPTKEIMIKDISNNNEFKKEVIIMPVKECYGTILAVELNENLAYVFGYAPVLSNKLYTYKGEFFVYKRQNGEVTEMKHIITTLTKEVSHNEIVEYIRDTGLSVSIEDKANLAFVLWGGYGYLIPSK